VIDGGWSGRRSTHREGTGFDTTGRLGPSLCSLFRVFSQSSIEYGGSGFRLDEKDVQLRVSPPSGRFGDRELTGSIHGRLDYLPPQSGHRTISYTWTLTCHWTANLRCPGPPNSPNKRR
jgi:hypothetical protein